jgi:predicted ATPase
MISRQFLIEVRSRMDGERDASVYPFCIPAIASLTRLKLHPRVTYFVGENGSGKSTLLEAIAVASGMNAEGGSHSFNFSTRASHSCLADQLLLIKGVRWPADRYFLRAESFYNVATELERLDERVNGRLQQAYGGSLHEKSHGESFLALFTRRLRGNGLYLLDEPEAALSPQRQLAVLRRIHELAEAGAQFIIATHSPLLLAYPGAWIYRFGDDGMVRTAYADVEAVQVTRDFMACPERMLKVLFD